MNCQTDLFNHIACMIQYRSRLFLIIVLKHVLFKTDTVPAYFDILVLLSTDKSYTLTPTVTVR